MKKAPFTLLFFSLVMGLLAQQEPQYNQYMYNRLVLNPAAAGINDAIYFAAAGRNQWIGYKDGDSNNVGPRTYGFTFDIPLYAIKSGAGINFVYNTLGAEKNINFRLNYAFQLSIKRKHRISIGLSLSMLSKSIDYSQLVPSEFDPMLSNSTEKGMMTDIGAGIHYQAFNRFYLGLSASNLLGSSAEIGAPEFELQRHYYIFSGYDIGMGNDMVLTPGILLRATPTAMNININAILTYREYLWGGVLFRTGSAAGIMAGINYNGFRLGLSYDYTLTTDFSKKRKHSIEAFLSYSYPISPKVVKKSGYNTRNL
jgi:type IX secretion system PorP/SprF family membrane protein